MDCCFGCIDFKPNKFAFLLFFLIQLNHVVCDNAVNKCDASCLGGGKKFSLLPPLDLRTQHRQTI